MSMYRQRNTTSHHRMSVMSMYRQRNSAPSQDVSDVDVPTKKLCPITLTRLKAHDKQLISKNRQRVHYQHTPGRHRARTPLRHVVGKTLPPVIGSMMSVDGGAKCDGEPTIPDITRSPPETTASIPTCSTKAGWKDGCNERN